MSTVKLSDFHVGDLIISFLKNNNIPQAHLARELSMATSNVNRLLKRDSMDTSLLLEISKKLKHNFFADISGDVQENKPFTLVSPQIGKHIEEKIKEQKMTQTQFATILNVTPAEVSRLIRKESFDTQKLLRISRILNYNFFRDFYQYTKNQEEGNVDGWASLLNRNEELVAEVALLKEKVKSQHFQIVELEKDLGTKFDTSFSGPFKKIEESISSDQLKQLKFLAERYNIDLQTFLYLALNEGMKMLLNEHGLTDTKKKV